MLQRLAREAGGAQLDAFPGVTAFSAADLRRFAALVAEECAKRCEDVGSICPNPGDVAGANWAQAAEYAAAGIRASFKP